MEFKKGQIAIVERNNNREIYSIFFTDIINISSRQIKTETNEIFNKNGVSKKNPNRTLEVITDTLKSKKYEIDKTNTLKMCKETYNLPDREPTRHFNIGDTVQSGNAIRVVSDIFENGLFYGFTDGGYIVLPWIHVFKPNNKIDYELREKEILEPISFRNQLLSSLFNMYYQYNVNMNPIYQRGLEWEDEDNECLIDSIFKNIEIGKFAFIENDIFDKNFGYEILDGKQRLNALVNFYEDRFTYKGKYFSDLSERDKTHFLSFNVTVGIVECENDLQKLLYFYRLNRCGKTITESHLKEIEDKINSFKK